MFAALCDEFVMSRNCKMTKVHTPTHSSQHMVVELLVLIWSQELAAWSLDDLHVYH
jgi:hypothetical protein